MPVLKRNRKRITSIVGLLIGLGAGIVILSWIDLAEFAAVLIAADYRYLLPSVVAFLLGLGTRAQRWRVLLSRQLPLRRAFHIMNIAYLVNGLLPLRIGELGRIFLTSRANRKIPAMHSGSTIVVERLLDVLAVVVLLMITIAVAPVPLETQRAGLIGGAASVAGFALLIFLGRQREPVGRAIGILQARSKLLTRISLQRHADAFLAGLSPILDGASLLSALFWTALSWLFSVLTNYALMLAFFEVGDWIPILLSIVFAAFAIAIPVVPGNIGTYELSIISAFTVLGYDQLDKVAAYAVAVHALNVVVNSLTGFVGLLHEGISLGNLRAQVEQLKQPAGQTQLDDSSKK